MTTAKSKWANGQATRVLNRANKIRSPRKRYRMKAEFVWSLIPKEKKMEIIKRFMDGTFDQGGGKSCLIGIGIPELRRKLEGTENPDVNQLYDDVYCCYGLDNINLNEFEAGQEIIKQMVLDKIKEAIK